ncbi:MAG TPA: HRDC domain-containing protein [Phycisphaerae bacterium]|nr:HRDC domain-containing protein [Phycisphaerae bacterium]
MEAPDDLPAVPTHLIQTPEELAGVCDELRAAGRFAFDTEFIGENTYQPVLCLVQVATAKRVELIDPFALREEALSPLWALIGDPAIEKICHAGDQDVEIVWQHSARVAQNVFDTQIGAGMMGLSYPTALWRAVEHFTGVTLEKAHTYSAWDRRPLSRAQFQYAIDDVRYLPAVHEAMKRRIGELGHLDWMRAACNEMCAASAAPVQARKLFVKIRGAAGLSGMQLSVLREATALREQIAYEHDVPSRSVMKDEALLEIATRMPKDEKALRGLREMPQEQLDTYAEPFLDAVRRGRAVPENEQPHIHIPGEDSAEVKRLGEMLWVAAQGICLGQSIAPGLVTSQNEVLSLARLVHRKKPLEKHALMTGWHRECLGEKLAAFVGGKLAVTLRVADGEMRAGFAGADSSDADRASG